MSRRSNANVGRCRNGPRRRMCRMSGSGDAGGNESRTNRGGVTTGRPTYMRPRANGATRTRNGLRITRSDGPSTTRLCRFPVKDAECVRCHFGTGSAGFSETVSVHKTATRSTRGLSRRRIGLGGWAASRPCRTRWTCGTSSILTCRCGGATRLTLVSRICRSS